MKTIYALALLFTLLATAAPAASLAIFDFELIDTSLDGQFNGPQKAEQDRLAGLAVIVREKLAAAGRYEIVDVAPVRERAKAANLQSCGQCDAALAREIGADLAMTGTVQKVSNLILNINIYIRDAKSGEMRDVMSVDIRGNTDESWSHGINWLLRNKLLPPPESPKP